MGEIVHAADYTLEFCTLTTGSGWNEADAESSFSLWSEQ